jgi:hypothetical protein
VEASGEKLPRKPVQKSKPASSGPLMNSGRHAVACHLPIIAEIAYAYTKKSLPFFPGTVAKIKRGDAFTATGELEWQLNP